jgi:hypothetical protein
MEATNLEIIVLLVTILGFGSSLIHYTAFAKTKAKVAVKNEMRKAYRK